VSEAPRSHFDATLGFVSRVSRQLRPYPVAIIREPTPVQDEKPPAGFSSFAAQVLDQLSLTAWLPAALLMADVYVVAGLYLVQEPDSAPTMDNLRKLAKSLNDRPFGIIIAVIFGIVLATLITQSLEFAAIRFLEGYWGGSILSASPSWAGISIQKLRLRLMRRRARKLDTKAFEAAAPSVRRAHAQNQELAAVIDSVGRGRPLHGVDDALLAQATDYYRRKTWMKYSPAHLRHRSLLVDTKLGSFPGAPSRVMPTRLGNSLRSAEDRIRGDVAGTRLRGYLINNLKSFDAQLLQQHNQYRNRLDMYAVMTVLSLALAALDAWLLPGVLPTQFSLSVAASFVVLSYLSYRGAISAAMDYGTVLSAMNRAVLDHERRR
jgi:hypothetical protein